MSDLREKLLNDVKMIISTQLSSKDASYVIDVLTIKLNDYDLTKRCTEVAVLDDVTDTVLLNNYKGCLLIEGCSSRTVEGYLYTLRRISKDCNKLILDIKTNDIRMWLARFKVAGKKNSYISNQRNKLNSFYNWALNEKLITENPCAPIKSIKVPYEEREAFSTEDMDSLRYSCENIIDRALIEFLASSGVRIEECANMLIENIDFDRMIVRVKDGKGGKDRTTYISSICKKYLLKYIEQRKDNDNHLFVNRFGNKYSTSGLQRRITNLAKKSGVDNAHPHKFRRTLATVLARRGMPIQEIQKILGHSDITVTQRYIETNTNMVEASYRKYAA